MPSAGRKPIGRLVKWAIWLGFVLVPVMAMGNCSGWNEGSMAVASCARAYCVLLETNCIT